MTGPLPLLNGQLDMWETFKETPENILSNTAERIVLHGPLDVQRLSNAMQLMLEDVTALHVRFLDDGEPKQDTGPEGKGAIKPRPLQVVDVQQAADPAAEANALIQKQIDQPFDLAAGELYQQTLYILAPDLHWWVFASHHIALDGYGIMLCLQRVANIYLSYEKQNAKEEYFDSFAAVIEQNQQYQQSEQPAADRQFFKAQYNDIPYEKPPFLDLGLSRGHSLNKPLPASLFKQLQNTALEHSVAWPHFLFGLIASYWSHQFGDSAVFLGVPVMQRLGSIAAKVPCMVMNTVPLRMDVTLQDSLLTLGQQARQAFAALKPHQTYRYERIWEDTNQHRIFGPEVNVVPYTTQLHFGPELQAKVENLAAGSIESLSLVFKVWNDDLHLQLNGHPDLYSAEQIATIHQDLQRVLVAALEQPTHALEPFWKAHLNLELA